MDFGDSGGFDGGFDGGFFDVGHSGGDGLRFGSASGPPMTLAAALILLGLLATTIGLVWLLIVGLALWPGVTLGGGVGCLVLGCLLAR